MTKISWNRDISVMMSSVMPAVKYSCSGSADMLVKGSTAIEGLSGNDGGPASAGAETDGAGASEGDGLGPASPDHSAADHSTRKACTGRPMFFSSKLPASSKLALMRPDTASR